MTPYLLVQVRSGRSCHRYHATLCYLPHAEKENSVKNLRCLAANISLEKRLQELTSRRNLELGSHRQFVVVINLVLATPATSMAPDRTGPAVPSGPVIAGGPANWARAGPPYPSALACALERILQLRLTASNQHGKRQSPVISHSA